MPISNFYFKEVDSVNWMNARVPGTVHTDLYGNKKIPNPYYGDNEAKCQWIEQRDWEYKSNIVVTSDMRSKTHIELTFEGLDTYADIYLNGKSILTADNMFRTWVVDVKPLLKLGDNELRLVFHSAYKSAVPIAKALNLELPAGNDGGEVKTSVFTRKAPYHYGWDWGPRFVTCGIWRSVYLKMWNDFKIEDLYVKQVEVSTAKAIYNLIAAIQVDTAGEYLVSVSINNKLAVNKECGLHSGINNVIIPLTIENPVLWWPNGMGAQNLYLMRVDVVHGNSKDNISKNIGIRKIELAQQSDSVGVSFLFKINDKPFFAKGANYIPMDNFLPNATNDKKDKLLKMAKEANFNMLRIWGGGVYEDDAFYELCDKDGIMVWQDFMFACSIYPWDSTFLNNVKVEAEQNIKRLRNHASLALWCGNNEIDEAWYNWGWQEQYKWSKTDSVKIWSGYNKLFAELLPSLVKENDAERNYIASSPKFGWGRDKGYTHGDSHYWGVWWGMAPFETYKTKVGRFASEYGFQALPNINSLEQFVPNGQMNTGSSAMKTHQKHGIGYQTINQYMKWYYPVPKTFEDTIYFSQLTQAYGIKTAIEAHRQNMPRCMGSLYWQLNDCWPSVSWSCIDYYFQPKALYYQSKHSFENVVLIASNKDSIASVNVVSDLLKNMDCQLKMSIIDFKGSILWTSMKDIQVKSATSQNFENMNVLKVSNFDSAVCVLNMQLLSKGIVVSENNHYFALPKNLKLPDCKPIINIESDKIGEYRILISSSVLIKDLFVIPSLKGELSDNYFDVLPSKIKTILFKSSEKGVLKIKYKILNDIK